ncbi:MAG: radical SAM protein, partial [Xanthomonadaceae bacterium]|nr:radical SAM protein [Xanthomonadaceae bacterium]
MKKAEILLVNPWITDFAAYDLWAKPLGLLYLGGILRRLDGVDVRLLDCLDLALLPQRLRQKVKRRRYGTGHY